MMSPPRHSCSIAVRTTLLEPRVIEGVCVPTYSPLNLFVQLFLKKTSDDIGSFGRFFEFVRVPVTRLRRYLLGKPDGNQPRFPDTFSRYLPRFFVRVGLYHPLDEER